LQLTQFFTSYLLFLLASSIAITAFFCVTRGEEEVQPDGSVRRYGKILKGYYFFWFKRKGVREIQYAGDELAALMESIREHFDGEIRLIGDVFKKETIRSFQTNESFVHAIPFLRKKLDVEFRSENAKDSTLEMAVFIEEPVYVFPEWLRTVMAGCITCTPTIYGNIIYWTAVAAFKNSILYNSLFGIFNNATVGVIMVWIAYWISLAWLNTVLWNFYDK
jgi:hypothetical protein